MIWFVTLQSFLFTSLALFTNGTFFGDSRGLVFIGFALIGGASAFFTSLSVGTAYDTMRDTRDQWVKNFPDAAKSKEYPVLLGGTDKITIIKDGKISAEKTTFAKNGRSLGQALPRVVLCFWVVIVLLSVAASVDSNSTSEEATSRQESAEK